MTRLRAGFVAVTAAAIVGSTATTAGAAVVHPVAVWVMNEPAGAHTMLDSSGHGLNGAIGTEVLTGTTVQGATGYRFTRLEPNTPPTHPQHLVVVPNNAALNPGTHFYA